MVCRLDASGSREFSLHSLSAFQRCTARLIAKLMAIGGVQLGLMYCFYYQSFLLLSVPEVLLFTVFTPIYVTLIYDFLKGRFSLGI